MACSWLNLEEVPYLRVFQDPERMKSLDPLLTHNSVKNNLAFGHTFENCLFTSAVNTVTHNTVQINNTPESCKEEVA